MEFKRDKYLRDLAVRRGNGLVKVDMRGRQREHRIVDAGMVRRDIRMIGKGCTRMVQTHGARPGVSPLSAKCGKAIGKLWNSYRRDALYALTKAVRLQARVSPFLYRKLSRWY